MFIDSFSTRQKPVLRLNLEGYFRALEHDRLLRRIAVVGWAKTLGSIVWIDEQTQLTAMFETVNDFPSYAV